MEETHASNFQALKVLYCFVMALIFTCRQTKYNDFFYTDFTGGLTRQHGALCRSHFSYVRRLSSALLTRDRQMCSTLGSLCHTLVFAYCTRSMCKYCISLLCKAIHRALLREGDKSRGVASFVLKTLVCACMCV